MGKELTFNEYLRRRDYKVPMEAGNVIWRWFFVSFAQPAFGGFWRVWNPIFGYYLAKLYRRLGGNRNRLIACVATFAACGFGHDLFNIITRSWDKFNLKVTFTFIMFGVLVAATSPLRIQRFMRNLPWYANVVVNVALLFFSFFGAHFAWKFVERTFLS